MSRRHRTTSLSHLTWPELQGWAPLLAVPLGSCEQHGPHLPFDTDGRVAVALAEGLAAAERDVVVAPVVAYGSSGEHAGFPGTLSIGQAALEHLVVELVRSADAFDGVVLVNGHGGNAEALARAAQQCEAEGRRVLVWSPEVPGGDAHAGRTETSLLLALAPEVVRTGQLAPGTTEPLAALLPLLKAEGVLAVSASGVLGDPVAASAGEGEAVLEHLVGRLVADVRAWRRGAGGAGQPAGSGTAQGQAGRRPGDDPKPPPPA